MWIDWRGNPSQTLPENPMPISAIPFPTLTVCLETKAYASKITIVQDQSRYDAFHNGNKSDIELV